MSIRFNHGLAVLLLAASGAAFADAADRSDPPTYNLPTTSVHNPVVTSEKMAADIDKSGHSVCYIAFVSGSAQLAAVSIPQIREIKRMLEEQQDLKIELSLQDSDVGTSQDAKNLAYQRAVSLVNALRDEDISSKRVVARPSTNPTAVAFNTLMRSR